MRTEVRALALLLALGLPAAAAAAGADAAKNPAARRGTVVLPSGRALEVEIADTPVTRARGYMYREKISEGEGMLFFMEVLDFHPFWMKNCKVGLDILWLNEGWQVVHIERDVPPCKADPCPDYQPMQASLYVLEMKAGASKKEGISLGDRIQYLPPHDPD